MVPPQRRLGGRLALAALAAAAAGCAASVRVEPLTSLPPTAEAISLLGDTLWSVGLDIATAQLRLERLQRARQHAAAKPDDVNAALGLARRTGGMGRLREAIQLANAGLERHYDDPRLYRLRGELLLRTRRLDLALRDLQAAAQLTMRDSTTAEFVEIDGVGLVGIGLRHSILLVLGQTYYVRGEFRRARAVLEESLEAASNADEAADAGVWLVLADLRAGPNGAGSRVVQAWREDAQVVIRPAEHRLLLAWQGTLPIDSLRAGMVDGQDREAEVLFTLAAGVAHLGRGELGPARQAFELVRSIGDWTAIPFLAAEAELRRLRNRGSGGSAGA